MLLIGCFVFCLFVYVRVVGLGVVCPVFSFKEY